jgi:hypothetical protein
LPYHAQTESDCQFLFQALLRRFVRDAHPFEIRKRSMQLVVQSGKKTILRRSERETPRLTLASQFAEKMDLSSRCEISDDDAPIEADPHIRL